jgi:hypothetical protein
MDNTTKRRLQAALVKIGREYHASACPGALVAAVREAGAPVGSLDGIYCGRDGRAVTALSDKVNLVHLWHRMESGRYEVTAYLG